MLDWRRLYVSRAPSAATESGRLRARRREGGSNATPQPEVCLSALKQATRDRFPAIGVGEDVRIAGDSIVGGGLVVDGKVVHLVAFPASAHPVSHG